MTLKEVYTIVRKLQAEADKDSMELFIEWEKTGDPSAWEGYQYCIGKEIAYMRVSKLIEKELLEG